MKLILPATVTDATLLASNVDETPPAAYNSGTGYSAGTEVSVASGSLLTIYEALPIINLITRSRELDHANWFKSGASVTANAAATPVDGTTTADKIIPDNSAAKHWIQAGFSAVAGMTYTGPVYLKAAEYSVVGIGFVNNGANGGEAFNLATGAKVAGTTNSPFSTTADLKFENVGNGWWRVSPTRQPNGTGNFYLAIYVLPDGSNYHSAGDGTSGVLAADAQVNLGASALSYQLTVATGGANVGYAPASSPTWWRMLSTSYAAWSSGTTYADGDRAISAATHRVYESLQNSNLNHALTDPAWWLDIGPTNRWAAFDQKVGTLVSRSGSISYQIATGMSDAVGLVDVEADSVTVSVSISGSPIYSKTKYLDLSGSLIDDWLDYFTGPVGTRRAVDFDDLPVHSTAIASITINGATSTTAVSVGTVGIGAARSLGSTEVGGEVGIMDFSRKETDDFGNVTVVERGYSKRMTLRSMIATDLVDDVQRLLASVRATPVIWIGEDGYDSLTIYGFFKDFSINMSDASGGQSYVSTTVEGLSTGL